MTLQVLEYPQQLKALSVLFYFVPFCCVGVGWGDGFLLKIFHK
jgi:hypothetical protein